MTINRDILGRRSPRRSAKMRPSEYSQSKLLPTVRVGQSEESGETRGENTFGEWGSGVERGKLGAKWTWKFILGAI